MQIEYKKLQKEKDELKKEVEQLKEKKIQEEKSRTYGDVPGLALISMTPASVVIIDELKQRRILSIGEDLYYLGEAFTLEKIHYGKKAVFKSSTAETMRRIALPLKNYRQSEIAVIEARPISEDIVTFSDYERQLDSQKAPAPSALFPSIPNPANLTLDPSQLVPATQGMLENLPVLQGVSDPTIRELEKQKAAEAAKESAKQAAASSAVSAPKLPPKPAPKLPPPPPQASKTPTKPNAVQDKERD